MRFSPILVSQFVASIGSAVTGDIGKLTAVPSLKPGDLFNIEFNASEAIAHPQFVDLYVHDGQTDALYQLGRFTIPYQANPKVFKQIGKLPVIDSKAPNGGYVASGKYAITALITYPAKSGALAVGRVDVPIQF